MRMGAAGDEAALAQSAMHRAISSFADTVSTMLLASVNTVTSYWPS